MKNKGHIGSTTTERARASHQAAREGLGLAWLAEEISVPITVAAFYLDLALKTIAFGELCRARATPGAAGTIIGIPQQRNVVAEAATALKTHANFKR